MRQTGLVRAVADLSPQVQETLLYRTPLWILPLRWEVPLVVCNTPEPFDSGMDLTGLNTRSGYLKQLSSHSYRHRTIRNVASQLPERIPQDTRHQARTNATALEVSFLAVSRSCLIAFIGSIKAFWCEPGWIETY